MADAFVPQVPVPYDDVALPPKDGVTDAMDPTTLLAKDLGRLPTRAEILSLKSKAEEGDAKSQFWLAELYARGDGFRKSLPESYKWREMAANGGNVDAQVAMGVACWRGDGMAKDSAAALVWFSVAASKGHADAQFAVGTLLSNGVDFPRNDVRAAQYFQKAAAQGHAQAQLGLSFMIVLGRGVKEDLVTAYKWLLLAVAAGDEYAIKNLPKLEADLSPAEKAEGKRLADAFVPVPER